MTATHQKAHVVEDIDVIGRGQVMNMVHVADKTEMKKAVIDKPGEVEGGKGKVDLDLSNKLVVDSLMMESILKVGDEDTVVAMSKTLRKGGIIERWTHAAYAISLGER